MGWRTRVFGAAAAAVLITSGALAFGFFFWGGWDVRTGPAALPASEGTLRERLSGLSVGAHRGRSLHSDGNTLAGFENARTCGADIIEMDLRATADGVPVIYHDPEIKWSTKGCAGRVENMTLAELRACRVGGEWPIPTFEEVLQWSAGRVVINAEFKVHEAIAPAIRLVRQYDAYDWTYFQTKNDPICYGLARKEDPRVALLYNPADRKSLDWILGQDDPNLMIIELDPETATDEFIAKIRAAGKLVSQNAWHYSWADEILGNACAEVFSRGIDIAITKQPCGCVESRDRLEFGR